MGASLEEILKGVRKGILFWCVSKGNPEGNPLQERSLRTSSREFSLERSLRNPYPLWERPLRKPLRESSMGASLQ